MSEALRLADEIDEFHGPSKDHASYAAQQAAIKLRRLVAERFAADEVLNDLVEKVRRLHAENEALRNAANRGGHLAVAQQVIDELKAELAEQARLVGMGSEREASLMTENEQLRHAMDGLTQRCVDDTALIGELVGALREIADDYANRFDLDSPITNPGIKFTIKQARTALAKAGVSK